MFDFQDIYKAFKAASKEVFGFALVLVVSTIFIAVKTLIDSIHFDSNVNVWVFSAESWFFYNFIPFFGIVIFPFLAALTLWVMTNTYFYTKAICYEKNKTVFT